MVLREVLSIPNSKIVFNKSGMHVKFSDKEVAAEKCPSQENGSEECLLEWCGVVVSVTLEVWQLLMRRPWEVT